MTLPTPTAAPAKAQPRFRLAADVSLVLATAVWGATFPVVKAALGHCSPILFNSVRMSLGAVFLLLVLRPRAISAAAWAASALLGLLLAGGYALQTAGLAWTSPAKAAFITGLSVIMVPLLLALFWRRKMQPRIWLACGLAVAGLYALVFGARTVGAAGGLRGEWLTLGCAVCFALQVIVLGEVAGRYPVRQLAALQILFCAIFSWVLLPVVETPRWQPTAGLWWELAVTALLATGFSFTAQTWGQQYTPAPRAAVIFSLEPVFGLLASYIGWHERLRPLQLAGAMSILAAIGAVEWRRRADRR